MKKILFTLLVTGGLLTSMAQEVIELPYEDIEGVTWHRDEMRYYSEVWQTTVVTNVSKPTMTVHRPSVDRNTGTAVVIAPGGGLWGLSINSEGVDVANWLVSKGVTAFVLKYRLVPSGDDGTREINEAFASDPEGTMKQVRKVLEYSVQDGLNAVQYVRENAETYGIQPDKIGFMGFSAGGAVTMGVGYEYEARNRPNFLVPVYPWTDAQPVKPPKEDAPPMHIICATDDGLGLASGSIALYNSWYKAEKSVEMHMYSKGDHGFGMKTQGFPSDTWIQRVYDWAVVEGIIEP